MADKITFFPVGNGDMTLITLENGKNFMIDCNFRNCDTDEDIFDCAEYLDDNLPVNEDGYKYVDVFFLTHHDQDHCRGINEQFNLCNLAGYDKEKIIIKELIVTPRLLKDESIETDCAKAVRVEADRRLDLFDTHDFNKDGNRLQIIGYSSELADYDSITTVAGNNIKLINGEPENNIEFFVLGPVKKDNDDDDAAINDTSIVLKISFIKADRKVVFVAGGDDTCDNWVDIVNKNSGLIYDMFIAPHHCSWFSISNEDVKTGSVNTTISNFLENSKSAYIISSSKPIKRNDDNPPSYRAKNEYKKHLDFEHRFICLGEYPNENETEPLILTISQRGITKEEAGYIKKSSIYTNSIYTPKTYGEL